MLYIEKGIPPREMVRKTSEIRSSREWKEIEQDDTKAIRLEFDKLPKEIIRQKLLEEQHYLCAYCMRKIANNGLYTTIEHWFPLSKDKDKALDYGNMLAVCDGGRNWKGKEQRILSCDASKGDKTVLNISPLNRRQMDVIAYDREGFIKTEPKDVNLEDELKDVLRLNGLWKDGQFLADTSTGLVKGRRDTYLRYKRFIKRLGDEGKCTSSRIKKKIDEIVYAEERPEYAGVLLYFLNKKYNSLIKREKM